MCAVRNTSSFRTLTALFFRALIILVWAIGIMFAPSCYFGDVKEAEKSAVIVPKINIRTGLVTLSSGGVYDFGKVPTATARSNQFIIENLGRDYLLLQGAPPVQVSGADAAMFSVTVQPSSPIGPFSFRNFTVVFTPASDGAKSATLTIPSTDPSVASFSIGLTGEGDPNIAPEINLKQGAADIASGTGSYHFGSTQTGTPLGPVTFTIQNTGTKNLNVSGVSKAGMDVSDFIINTGALTSPVIAGKDTTFTITFNPSTTGSKTATITVTNDDADEGAYTFAVTGTGTAAPVQDIHLTQSSAYLPNTTGVYNFGSINQGASSAAIQFTISNRGTANLGVSGFNNSNTTDFSASFPGTPLMILPSQTQTFSIEFTPKSAGLRTAVITINNDDPDENPYTFTLQGTGVAVPEMDVFQGGNPAVNGVYSHNFGSIQAGSASDAVFTIKNIGTGTLSLPATERVEITGDPEFSVTAFPGSTIPGGGTDSFTIRFSPLIPGSYSAIVSIANNDSDENPYIFDVKGVATLIPMPKIDLWQGSSPVLISSEFDMGGMTVGASPVDVAFTVKNIGSADLNLTAGPPRVAISGDGEFTLLSDASTPVPPTGSSNFTLRFNATDISPKSATVTIASNDSDEPSYQFTVRAVGTSPEIHLKQDSTDIPKGDTFSFGNVNLNASSRLDFTIENKSANSVLLLTGNPKVSSSDPTHFSVVAQPPTSSIAASSSAVFSVKYTPSGAGAANATISIDNNDADENPYTFTVTGTGVNPDIIVRNDTPADLPTGGNFDFGNVKYTLSPERQFTIHNKGTHGDLHLKSSPNVIVSGADAGYFSVTQPANSAIAPGLSEPFSIKFNPSNSTSVGEKTATVSIYSDDVDTPVYQFTVKGKICVPNIAVTQGVTSLPDGTGVYDFGNGNKGSSSAAVTFNINNTGDAELALSGGPNYVVLSDSTHFTITEQPSTGSISPAGTTTFKAVFNPQALGYQSTTVTIVSDDPDEGTYTFELTGTGVDTEAPVVNVTSPGGGSYVRGNIPVQAVATDNVGVVQVEFFVGGNSIGTDTVGPEPDFSVNWNTTSPGDGLRAIRADATDAAANTGTDNDTSVTVDNTPPNVSIGPPSVSHAKNGTDVKFTLTYTDANFDNSSSLKAGDITLNATGGASGSIAVDGANGNSREVTISNVTGDGTIGISVKAGTAVDKAGNTADAGGPSATFIVDNTPPTVTIDSPAEFAVVDATTTIAFTPSETGTTNMVRIDAGSFASAVSGATFGSLSGWEPVGTSFTVEIYCIDAAGNKGSSTTRSFTK